MIRRSAETIIRGYDHTFTGEGLKNFTIDKRKTYYYTSPNEGLFNIPVKVVDVYDRFINFKPKHRDYQLSVMKVDIINGRYVSTTPISVSAYVSPHNKGVNTKGKKVETPKKNKKNNSGKKNKKNTSKKSNKPKRKEEIFGGK